MDSIFATMISMLSIIAPCIVFGACCYYLSKKTAVEAILMAIGSGLGLLIHVFYLLMPFLMNSKNLPYTDVSKYYTVAGIISFITSMCFAAGFLILIINTFKKNQVVNDQSPKSID